MEEKDVSTEDMLATLKRANTVQEMKKLDAVPREQIENLLNDRAMGEGYGTQRQQLMQQLEDSQNEFRDAFQGMTSVQKAYGRLVSNLCASWNVSKEKGKKHVDVVEDCFTWFETEYGTQLTNMERCLALFQAAETHDVNDPAVYRAVRKVFLLMNNTD